MSNEFLYLEGILNGLLELAFWRSGGCPSMVRALTLEPEDRARSLAEITGLKTWEVALVPENEDWREIIRSCLKAGEEGDRTMAVLADLFSFHLGETKGFRRFAAEDLVKRGSHCYDDGWGPFYYTEDVFVVSFEKCDVLFVMGNDE